MGQGEWVGSGAFPALGDPLCSAASDKGQAGRAWWGWQVAQIQPGSGLMRRSLKHGAMAHHYFPHHGLGPSSMH